jgi:amino acid transporter
VLGKDFCPASLGNAQLIHYGLTQAEEGLEMNYSSVKRVLIGEPFPTKADIHERLDKLRALAVFASDPISSNAYATEAIMGVLILLGSGALALTMPIAIGIALLILLVIFSYVQTILHYPQGGGAYTVAKDNLGKIPSLFAAAALLTDYILTVSVSVSAGIRALTSAFPELFDAARGVGIGGNCAADVDQFARGA